MCEPFAVNAPSRQVKRTNRTKQPPVPVIGGTPNTTPQLSPAPENEAQKLPSRLSKLQNAPIRPTLSNISIASPTDHLRQSRSQ
jgi:hypothetical protein